MATIKSYSDLEQSRKLAEILPLESADMGYLWNGTSFSEYPVSKQTIFNRIENIPCWSLAALLGVLPKTIGRYNKTLGWFDDSWHCDYIDEDSESIGNDTLADNPVDACYEMILNLHKMNLL